MYKLEEWDSIMGIVVKHISLALAGETLYVSPY